MTISGEYVEWVLKSVAARALTKIGRSVAAGTVFLVLLALCECKGEYRKAIRKLVWGSRGVALGPFRGNSVLATLALAGLGFCVPQLKCAGAALWTLNLIVETRAEVSRIRKQASERRQSKGGARISRAQDAALELVAANSEVCLIRLERFVGRVKTLVEGKRVERKLRRSRRARSTYRDKRTLGYVKIFDLRTSVG